MSRTPTTLYTFGDSILDCGGYNARGVHPAGLLVHNDDEAFPDFRGRDLTTRASGEVQLEHRAVDGATVAELPAQALGLELPDGPSVALVTIGGNDLLRGLLTDRGPGLAAFARSLETFVASLPLDRVLLGNVYDPTFGDDARNFTGLNPARARAALRAVNAAIAEVAGRHGALVDLHAHFLAGDPSWFVQQIEPSLRGASEIRRAFLPETFKTLGVPA